MKIKLSRKVLRRARCEPGELGAAELMCIGLAVIADTADKYLRNHAAELAEREAQNLALIRTEARSLLKKMTDEETKGESRCQK